MATRNSTLTLVEITRMEENDAMTRSTENEPGETGFLNESH